MDSNSTEGGYLYKKGEKGVLHSWKKRYFFLDENSVIHYSASPKEEVINSIHLNLDSEVQILPDEESKYQDCYFQISNKNEKRVYFLRAETPEARMWWLSTIRDAIKKSHQAPEPPKKSNRKTRQINKITNATTDDKRLEVLNSLFDEIENLCKKDFDELLSILEKYYEANENLSGLGTKIASEIEKCGAKIQSGLVQSIGNDFKVMEGERARHIRSEKLNRESTQFKKDLETFWNRISERKKLMQKKNKEWNSALEKHLEAISKLSIGESTQAMLETQQLFVQIDSLRDEMIAEMNYEKSNILQRIGNYLHTFFIGIKSFNNVINGSLENIFIAFQKNEIKLQTVTSTWETVTLNFLLSSSSSNDNLSNVANTNARRSMQFSKASPQYLTNTSPMQSSKAFPQYTTNTYLEPTNSTSPGPNTVSSRKARPLPNPRSPEPIRSLPQVELASKKKKEAQQTAWIKYFTEDGTPYYYNTITQETVWEIPKEE